MLPSPKEDSSSVLRLKTLEFAAILNHNCFSSEANGLQICLIKYNFTRARMSETVTKVLFQLNTLEINIFTITACSSDIAKRVLCNKLIEETRFDDP